MVRRTSLQSLSGLEGHGDIAIRPAAKTNYALISIGTKRAVEYDLDEKQIIKSYFVPSHLNLSTPLSYDNLSKSMVCVVNKTSLLVWDGQENHLERLKETKKLKVSVTDILASDGTLILCFENGDLQPLNYVLESTKVPTIIPMKCGKDVKMTLSWSKDVQYCIKKGSLGVELCQISIDSESGEFNQQTISFIPLKKVEVFEVVGLTLVKVSTNQQHLQLQNLLAPDCPESIVPLENDMLVKTLVALDDNHVVIHCSPTNNEEGLFFQAIDMNYGTVASLQVKSMTSLALQCFQSDKVLFKQGNYHTYLFLGNCQSQLLGIGKFMNDNHIHFCRHENIVLALTSFAEALIRANWHQVRRNQN